MTAREQRLGLALGVTLVLVGTYFADDWLRRRAGELKDEVAQLQSRQRVEQALLLDEAELREDHAWLESRSQPLEAGAVQAELMESVEEHARVGGLSINSKQLLPLSGVGQWGRTRVEFTVQGNEEQLLRFIARQRDRDRLQAVESIELYPAQDHTALIGKVVVQRLFLPAEPLPAAT